MNRMAFGVHELTTGEMAGIDGGEPGSTVGTPVGRPHRLSEPLARASRRHPGGTTASDPQSPMMGSGT